MSAPCTDRTDRTHRGAATPDTSLRRVSTLTACWFALSAAGAALGCQGHLSSGIVAFDEARYPDAGAELRQVDQNTLDGRTRTRWALYLGLSELALGNVARASCALERARSGMNQIPDALSAQERGRLDAAWKAMGKAPGEALIDLAHCSS